MSRRRKLHPSEYAKALVAALAGGLATLAGSAGDGISAQEWLIALAFTVGSFGAVFGTPNKPPAGVRPDPQISEQG